MPGQIEVVACIIETGEDLEDVALRGCVREHCCWIKVLVHDDDIRAIALGAETGTAVAKMYG